jgi:tetratricopeptide (TPR) repeat protein
MAQKKARAKAGIRGKRAGRGASEVERFEKALEALEKSIRTLHKGDTERAREQLQQLKRDFPDEGELMDRVNSYLAVCERKLSPQKRPKTTEEMVVYGVMLHNDGDSREAIKMLSKALESDPRNAHIEYCLAAAHAKIGDGAATAKHLKEAIESDPLSRIHARADEDFAPVRHVAEVSALLSETRPGEI